MPFPCSVSMLHFPALIPCSISCSVLPRPALWRGLWLFMNRQRALAACACCCSLGAECKWWVWFFSSSNCVFKSCWCPCRDWTGFAKPGGLCGAQRAQCPARDPAEVKEISAAGRVCGGKVPAVGPGSDRLVQPITGRK